MNNLRADFPEDQDNIAMVHQRAGFSGDHIVQYLISRGYKATEVPNTMVKVQLPPDPIGASGHSRAHFLTILGKLKSLPVPI